MSEDIKKGLMGVTVDETEISKVMPEINSLTYRGYAAQDLCANCKFEEVAFLILNGELPNRKQLKDFEKQEKKDRNLSKNLIDAIKKIPKKAHPMDVARTAVSIMGLEDQETKEGQDRERGSVFHELYGFEVGKFTSRRCGKARLGILPDCRG